MQAYNRFYGRKSFLNVSKKRNIIQTGILTEPFDREPTLHSVFAQHCLAIRQQGARGRKKRLDMSMKFITIAGVRKKLNSSGLHFFLISDNL